MSPDTLLGWFASGLVFAAFCARDMLPLRLLAIASNFAFIGYGYADQLWPIVVLHGAMLPMNIIRLREVVRALPDPARAVSAGDMEEPHSAAGQISAGRRLRHKVRRPFRLQPRPVINRLPDIRLPGR